FVDVYTDISHHNYPSQDFHDQIDGVDAVIAKGFINENELFVTGGSGGGALTAWIVGHTERFAAAVSGKPVINWFSFVLNADMYSYFTQYWFPAMPWENPQHYLKYSPISYVGRSEEHTSELQSRENLVCRLLLEKKNK